MYRQSYFSLHLLNVELTLSSHRVLCGEHQFRQASIGGLCSSKAKPTRRSPSIQNNRIFGLDRHIPQMSNGHLMLYRMLEQRCLKWSIPLYTSTIDFKKAFDRIRHQSLWTSLAHFDIETPYIDLL